MHFKSKIKKIFIQFETKYLPNFQNCIKMYGFLAVFTMREMN